MTTTTTTDAQAFDGSWSAAAVFTVSGEPLGSAFLQGNKARIVPVSQPTASLPLLLPPPVRPPVLPPARYPHPRRTAVVAKTSACVYWETAQDVGAARVPSGSRPRQPKQWKKMTKGKGKGKMAGRGRQGKRIQFFVGSLEPLLGPRRRRRRRHESLTTLDNDDEDGNLGEGGDVDADADADDGIWPGEYVVRVPSTQTEDMARITPEEVERAIGAAFTIGTPA